MKVVFIIADTASVIYHAAFFPCIVAALFLELNDASPYRCYNCHVLEKKRRTVQSNSMH